MNQKELSSSDVYTMKKFLNSYVNQQRFFGQLKKPDNESTILSKMIHPEVKNSKKLIAILMQMNRVSSIQTQNKANS
jgi:hypothetical protein